MTQLKRIDFTKQSFMANGKEYFIENGFSISRYCEYQVLEKELGFGNTFKGMYDKLLSLYDLMNKVKFVEASVALNNMLTGITKIEEREPSMLKLCALFINTKDEDRTTITDDLIAQKINDWKVEGIEIKDFFTLALNTMDGFIEAYKNLTQTTSEITGENATEAQQG